MFTIRLLASLFSCSLATLVERQNEKPNGKVDPSTIKDCTYWYNSIQGDTCEKIQSQCLLSRDQLVLYNPSIKSDCSGLAPGNAYCVEVNFGASPNPTTTSGEPGSGPPTGTSTSAPGRPSPTQNGLISTCTTFYKVIKGDSCSAIVEKYGTFDLGAFYSWNPAVGTDCMHLEANTYVCVGIPGTRTIMPTTTSPLPTSTPINGPSPQQSGIISTCSNFYKAKSGDSCWAISNQYKTFTTDEFIAWNPAVGKDCQRLLPGYNYCVGVPGKPTSPPPPNNPVVNGPQPQQPGTVSYCKKYYKVKKGQGCWDIQQSQNVSLENWAKWNQGVNSNCGNLQADVYVCVGV